MTARDKALIGQHKDYFSEILKGMMEDAVLPSKWPSHSELQNAARIIRLANYRGPLPQPTADQVDIINRAFVGEFDLDGLSDGGYVDNHVRLQHAVNELFAGEVHIIVHQDAARGTVYFARGLRVLT